MSRVHLRRLALFVPTLIGVSIVVVRAGDAAAGDRRRCSLQDAKSRGDEAACGISSVSISQSSVQYVDWGGDAGARRFGCTFVQEPQPGFGTSSAAHPGDA